MKTFTPELFYAQSGILSARLNSPDKTIHLHSIVKPECECDYFDDVDIWGDRVIFLGTGLGYHISKIAENIPAGTKVILVEFYKEFADICKKEYFDDDVEILSSETVSNVEKIQLFCTSGHYVQIIKHPASYYAQQEFYDSLIQFTCSKKPDNAHKNVMLLYGNFFLQEELRSALKQNNCNPVIYDYRIDESMPVYQSHIQHVLQSGKPEYVLSVNMLGFDGNGVLSEFAWRYGIPVVVWFVDSPVTILLQQRQFIKPNMIACCWEKSYIPYLKKAGFQKVEYLPLATDPNLFSKVSLNKYSTELGFVGSAMGCTFLDLIADKFMWNKSLLPIIKRCTELFLQTRTQSLDRILDDTCKEYNFVLPFSDQRNRAWLNAYITHNASMVKRKQIVGALMEYNIETFGDPDGWNALLGNDLITHPDIDYRTQLASTYRNIAININITSCQMTSAVNQRVFDIPLSGGFLMNDYQEDLLNLFDSDEIVVYQSIDELKDKLNYYRLHESERTRIVARASDHIFNAHTYKNRVSSINTIVRS